VYEELSHVERAWNQFLEKLDLLILKQEQIFPNISYS
jgi:hypothetical protein